MSVARSSSVRTKMADEKSNGDEADSDESSCATRMITLELGEPSRLKAAEWAWAWLPDSVNSLESNCRFFMYFLYAASAWNSSAFSFDVAPDDSFWIPEGPGWGPPSWEILSLSVPDLEDEPPPGWKSMATASEVEASLLVLSPLMSGRKPTVFRAFVTSFDKFIKSLKRNNRVRLRETRC